MNNVVCFIIGGKSLYLEKVLVEFNDIPVFFICHNEDEYYAVYAYENREGNCYCYAAAFYQLALELGYDAEFIQGEVGMAAGGTGPHGWVEIHVNGGTYVCDPDAEYETGRNAYMVTYASAPFKYYK